MKFMKVYFEDENDHELELFNDDDSESLGLDINESDDSIVDIQRATHGFSNMGGSMPDSLISDQTPPAYYSLQNTFSTPLNPTAGPFNNAKPDGEFVMLRSRLCRKRILKKLSQDLTASSAEQPLPDPELLQLFLDFFWAANYNDILSFESSQLNNWEQYIALIEKYEDPIIFYYGDNKWIAERKDYEDYYQVMFDQLVSAGLNMETYPNDISRVEADVKRISYNFLRDNFSEFRTLIDETVQSIAEKVPYEIGMLASLINSNLWANEKYAKRCIKEGYYVIRYDWRTCAEGFFKPRYNPNGDYVKIVTVPVFNYVIDIDNPESIYPYSSEENEFKKAKYDSTGETIISNRRSRLKKLSFLNKSSGDILHMLQSMDKQSAISLFDKYFKTYAEPEGIDAFSVIKSLKKLILPLIEKYYPDLYEIRYFYNLYSLLHEIDHKLYDPEMDLESRKSSSQNPIENLIDEGLTNVLSPETLRYQRIDSGTNVIFENEYFDNFKPDHTIKDHIELWERNPIENERKDLIRKRVLRGVKQEDTLDIDEKYFESEGVKSVDAIIFNSIVLNAIEETAKEGLGFGQKLTSDDTELNYRRFLLEFETILRKFFEKGEFKQNKTPKIYDSAGEPIVYENIYGNNVKKDSYDKSAKYKSARYSTLKKKLKKISEDSNLSEAKEFFLEKIKKEYPMFSAKDLPSVANFREFANRIIPSVVFKNIFDCKSLKACGSISWNFGVVANNNGIPTLTAGTHNHFFNVVLTKEGFFLVDLSAAQFDFDNYLDENKNKVDINDNYVIEKLLRKYIKEKIGPNPFKAVVIYKIKDPDIQLIANFEVPIKSDIDFVNPPVNLDEHDRKMEYYKEDYPEYAKDIDPEDLLSEQHPDISVRTIYPKMEKNAAYYAISNV